MPGRWKLKEIQWVLNERMQCSVPQTTPAALEFGGRRSQFWGRGGLVTTQTLGQTTRSSKRVTLGEFKIKICTLLQDVPGHRANDQTRG